MPSQSVGEDELIKPDRVERLLYPRNIQASSNVNENLLLTFGNCSFNDGSKFWGEATESFIFFKLNADIMYNSCKYLGSTLHIASES